MLALHGVTGHGGRFRRLAERGLPERRWLAPDLRGHGRSTWDPPWNAEQHVADLLETMDAEGVERCDVLGHSFGGLLATHLAARRRSGWAGGADRPGDRAGGHEMLEAAEETRHDEGWATAARPGRRGPSAGRRRRCRRGGGPGGGAGAGRGRPLPVPLLPLGVITAWGEMARPPASLAGFRGELLLMPALQDDIVGRRCGTRSRRPRRPADRAGHRGRPHGLLGRVRRAGGVLRACCAATGLRGREGAGGDHRRPWLWWGGVGG